MRGGDLKKRITIEQPVRTADGAGEMLAAWVTFAALWAGLEPLVGNEKIQAQQINASANMGVTLRYYPGITPQMRVVFGSRTMQIVSVQNIEERNRELRLLCVEEQ